MGGVCGCRVWCAGPVRGVSVLCVVYGSYVVHG